MATGQTGAEAGVNTADDAEALFATLFSDAGASSATAGDPPADSFVSNGTAAADPVLTPAPAPAPAPSAAKSSGYRSRAERFAPRESPEEVATGQVSTRDEKAASGGAAQASVPTSVHVTAPQIGKTSGRSRYVDQNQTPEAVKAKRNMAAAKVITPLVAAVSFAPGSGSAGASKSRALSEMLAGVHRCAIDTAEAISAQTGQDVPAWMVTQLMASLSSAVATRWQRGNGADLDALASAMKEIFIGDDPVMANILQGASEDAYVEVNHPDVARFRISVSAANAAWTIYDWVTHERLSLDSAGDMPSRFFTYNLATHELVNKILTRCVNECRALVVQVESADLRTAHMQASIGRMANLMGTEYVTRTRAYMNWIGDPTIDDAEYMRRQEGAAADLDASVLPAVFDYARVNFLRIEQGALGAIEELNEQSKNSQSGSGVSDRSAPA